LVVVVATEAVAEATAEDLVATAEVVAEALEVAVTKLAGLAVLARVEALEVVAMKLVDLARVEALEVVKMTLVELEVLALAVDSVKKKEKQKINLTQNANANNSWKLETSQLSHTLTTVKLPWLIE
jgi:hypothetical protein